MILFLCFYRLFGKFFSSLNTIFQSQTGGRLTGHPAQQAFAQSALGPVRVCLMKTHVSRNFTVMDGVFLLKQLTFAKSIRVYAQHLLVPKGDSF
jgi:hypothetical protein